MTIEEANNLLNLAPIGNLPSRINPGLTQQQAVDIIRAAVNSDSPRALHRDGVLDPILEKRVHQVNRNQKNPKY